jgi:hypothetical protein
MSLASRVHGFASNDKRHGISLDEAAPWRINPSADVKRFVHALPVLAPNGAVAYFEGTRDPRVAAFLGRLAVESNVQVVSEAVWPRPDAYHLPISTDLMGALARFVEETQPAFFCTHTHVYCNGVVLLQWHDAFGKAHMQVSRALAEETVRAFAAALGVSLR